MILQVVKSAFYVHENGDVVVLKSRDKTNLDEIKDVEYVKNIRTYETIEETCKQINHKNVVLDKSCFNKRTQKMLEEYYAS